MTRGSRECPVCGRDKVVSRVEARSVFSADARVNRVFDRHDDAAHACSYTDCGAWVSKVNSDHRTADGMGEL